MSGPWWSEPVTDAARIVSDVRARLAGPPYRVGGVQYEVDLAVQDLGNALDLLEAVTGEGEVIAGNPWIEICLEPE
jgi:hypothetical protein